MVIGGVRMCEGFVVLPRVREGMAWGTLVEVCKGAGEGFGAGEPLFEVEVDKVVFEVEAEWDGTVLEVLFETGDRVPVGEAVMKVDFVKVDDVKLDDENVDYVKVNDMKADDVMLDAEGRG